MRFTGIIHEPAEGAKTVQRWAKVVALAVDVSQISIRLQKARS